MERKILGELQQYPASKIYQPLRTIINRILNKLPNDKNVSSSNRDVYLRTFKEIDFSISKVNPNWPYEVERILDNLKTSIQQFQRVQNDLARGSSLFCGSSSNSKTLQPVFRQILSYEKIFQIIGIYQDKRITQSIINKTLEVLEKNNSLNKNPQNSRVKNQQSAVKQSSIAVKVSGQTKYKQHCDYCELYLASTILPNGFIVKKLLRELPNTQWIAGILHQEGKILDKDLKKAIKYYEIARNKNNPEAIYRLGLLNQSGKYGRPNQYIKMWQEASKMDHLSALTDLGYLYENGLEDENTGRFLIDPNPEKALNYYNQAAKENYPRALNNLASFYYTSQKHKNPTKCIQYFQRAVDAEYVKSLHNLALLYTQGSMVPHDEIKAAQLMKRSAEKGDIQGKILYTQMVLIEPNKFGQQQFAQVNKYCREVIAQDEQESDAYYFLGMMYENGYGVAQEPKTALLYYQKAARLENPNANIRLGECYKNGFGVEKDLNKAIKYFEKAKQTNPEVYVYLGQLYQMGGPDLKKNYQIAFSYYYNGCNYNIPEAFQAIGHMYRDGRHVKQNLQKADQYTKKGKQLKRKPKLSSSSQLIQSSYYRKSKK